MAGNFTQSKVIQHCIPARPTLSFIRDIAYHVNLAES